MGSILTEEKQSLSATSIIRRTCYLTMTRLEMSGSLECWKTMVSAEPVQVRLICSPSTSRSTSQRGRKVRMTLINLLMTR
jgi:hypothetical protein